MENIVPLLPLSLQQLLEYYKISLKELDFFIKNLEGFLEHLDFRMKPSSLVSVRFNSYESYFVSALTHLKWRLSAVCVDESYSFNKSKFRKAIFDCDYKHSGVAHPIGVEEINPMIAVLEILSENLNSLILEIEASMLKSIFLCHSSVDKPFVRRIAEDLTLRGSRVWLDEAEIKVGDSILAKIAEGIKTSDYLGVVMSEKSVNSVWVTREFEAALADEIDSGGVKVVPILLSDCEIPVFLKPKRYADFRVEEKYIESINAIIERLSKD
jgi:TIR domain